MCILICNGETIAYDLPYSLAMREARVAARLLGSSVTIYNVKTKETIQWTN
jgi:hypothetical protein